MDIQDRISRRRALQVAGASLVAATGAESLLNVGSARAAGGSIVFFTYAVYSDPTLTSAFTKSTGTKVVPANFGELDTMVSKLRAGRGKGYDVISVASNLVTPLAQEGLLQPIDTSRVKNWKHLYSNFRSADFIRYKGKVYGMPTVWGPEGLIYRTDKIKSANSWDILWDPKYKGKLSTIDYDYEMVLIAAIRLGYTSALHKNPISFTPAQLNKIKSSLITQVKLDAKLWADTSGAEALLSSGDSVATVGRILFLTDLKKKHLPVKLVTPKEGTQGWVTSTCISAGASNVPGSYSFLDYVTSANYGVPLGLNFGYPSASEKVMTHIPAHKRQLMFLRDPNLLDKMVFWKGSRQHAGMDSVVERRESLDLGTRTAPSEAIEQGKRGWAGRTVRPALLTPAVGWYALFFIVPLILLIRVSFASIVNYQLHYSWTLDSYHNLLNNPLVFRLLKRSLFLASGVTALTFVIGLPAAWLIARRPPRQRQALLLLLIIPWWSSYIVRVFAWRTAFGDHGVLNSLLQWLGLTHQPVAALTFGWTGIVVAETNLYLPLMIVPLYMSIERLDPDLVRAARSLGASPVRAFLRVFLPLIAPGIMTGLLFVFMPMTGEFIVPTLIGAPGNLLYGNEIASDFGTSFNWNEGAALAVFLLIALMIVVVLLRLVSGRATRNLRGV